MHLRFEARRAWSNIQRTHLHAFFFSMMQLTPPTHTWYATLRPEVDHGRSRRDFVLANSDPGAPHAGVTQANIRKDHQGNQSQDQIIVRNWRDAVPHDTWKSRREDAGNAISSPGDVIQLEKDNRD